MTTIAAIFAAIAALLVSGKAHAATRGRLFKYNPRVARWEADIAVVQAEEGTSIPLATVLAIIQVESEGDPSAHRKGSQFYGLTQVGRAVAEETKTSREKMHEGGTEGAREAIRAFCRWSKMYAKRHQWKGELMALGWKGGVGTLKSYNKQMAAGDDPREVRRWLDERRWGTWKYVRKWRAAHSIWSSCDPTKAESVRVK